jgi:glycosyltransferase involved in cell wall biosynthesis
MPNTKKIQKVAIYQHRLLHYRVKLFYQLHEKCSANNIELHLIHGQPSMAESSRKDVGSLAWSTPVKNKFLNAWGVDLLWQPSPDYIKEMDLVIVMQENRILSNYPIILKRKLSNSKVAYWGHGANFQSRAPSGLREKWKSYWLNSVDWWFSYTDVTSNILTNGGFPRANITTLNNSIDTFEFKDQVASFTEDELNTLRQNHSMLASDKVAVFCGSLYPDKKIGLMLEACDLIKQKIPNFHLVVIGDGPSAAEVKEAAKTRPWIHFPGVQKGRDKAVFFRIADVMLNPGLLGLHILDAFCIGMPLVSTVNALHSPEIAYLKNESNGILVKNDTAEDYAATVARLLSDNSYYDAIANQALEDGKKYTLENMVDNFYNGIVNCLAR